MNGCHFEGEVKTQWLQQEDQDRRMVLLEDFAFVDPNGKRWLARAGREIDGASIPGFLWSEGVGTPYVGDFRRASVIHDVACHEQTEPHQAVHRMFYDAMICDGVPEAKAQRMYLAVRLFGPSWTVGAAADVAVRAAAAPEPAPMDIDDLERLIDDFLDE